MAKWPFLQSVELNRDKMLEDYFFGRNFTYLKDLTHIKRDKYN